MRSSHLFLALSAALFVSCSARAADLFVPGQYPTIQSAVTAAVTGDRVLVSPGIYPESINLQGKRIRLESLQGAPSTLLDRGPVGGGGTLVTTDAGTTVETVIKGFTLRAASTGILVSPDAALKVENCVFQSLTARGIRVSGGEVQVVSCTFAGNSITENGTGGACISAVNSNVLVASSEFSNNSYMQDNFVSERFGGAIQLVTSSLVAESSVFSGNRVWGRAYSEDRTSTGGGAIAAHGGTVDLQGCRFESNRVFARANELAVCSGRGGALLVDGANLIVRPGCVFVGNSVETSETSSNSFMITVARGGSMCIRNAPSAVTITGATMKDGFVAGPDGADGAELRILGPIALTVTQCRFERTNNNAIAAVTLNAGSIFFTANIFERPHFAIATSNTGGIVQQCQFRNAADGCVSASSQITIRNNEVCNPPPQPYQGTILDGGGNFTRPVCLAADCNNNGLEDTYDISTGSSADCNANAVPDECEIASGAEADCDADEVLDSCQLSDAYLTSPSLGPVNAPTVLTHTFQGVARAGSAVTVTFDAVADLNSPLEYITPRFNGSDLDRLWENDAYDCPAASVATRVLSASDFNLLLGSGSTLQVAFTPSAAVSAAGACANSFVRVRLEYQPLTTNDCDGNGALDFCEIQSGTGSDANNNGVLDRCEDSPCSAADFNANGVVDGTDLAVVLAGWGPCTGSSCPADINGDGSVNGFDLSALLAAWGPCSP